MVVHIAIYMYWRGNTVFVAFNKIICALRYARNIEIIFVVRHALSALYRLVLEYWMLVCVANKVYSF